MFETAIAGSLPKPAWLAETQKLWPQWKAQGDELRQAKADATLLWIKAQEDAGLDVVGDGEQVTALELDDGTTTEVGAVFVARLPVPNAGLATAVGAAADEFGFLVTDEQRTTTVPGLWAVGDVRTRMHQMSMAIADGTMAGAAATAFLLSEL